MIFLTRRGPRSYIYDLSILAETKAFGFIKLIDSLSILLYLLSQSSLVFL
jgi:hypothetical protein